MADVPKLKKQVLKAKEAEQAAKTALHDAIDEYGKAAGLLAVIREELEHAEALAIALEMRGKKNAE